MSHLGKYKKGSPKQNWRERYQQRLKQSRGQTMEEEHYDNKLINHGTGQSKVTLNKSTIYVVGIVVAVLFVLLVVDIKLKLDVSKPATQAEGEGHQQNHQVNHSHQKSSPTFKQTTLILKKDCQPKKIYCADVLHEAVKGHWSKQHHTINPWQQDSIEKIRTKLGLPIHMTRKDSRCGLHFPIPNTRLAALCNSTGSNSHCCCESTGFCGNTKEHCGQPTSFDMKKLMSEQNVAWLPQNNDCRLDKKLGKKIWCNVLSKTVKRLIFFGDSQARNFFISLVSLLTENYKDAGIAKRFRADPNAQKNCTGAHQILNHDCRRFLIRSSKEVYGGICDGEHFEISYYPHFDSFVSKDTEKMLQGLYGQINTYVILSSGTHFNSDYRSFIHYFFEYMVKLKKNSPWPHYLVETLHEVISPESNTKRREFNTRIKQKAKQLGVEVFDGTLLSKNLESFDGRNYGMAFHSLKAKVLLHYFYNKNAGC
ncbi:uncharacterized protein [Clytia hemisphaerica]|uniref:Uncharacterized protein n=1 Tax=Clytia hemisphaerica TaxID=252671 RepID=A0A7M6DRK5_9CNID